MADNFDNYGMKVRATVDMPSITDIDKQIRKLEKSISKLKVSGQFDDTALKSLTHQLDTLKATVTTANFSPAALTELTNQVNRALQNINIENINVGNIGNQAKQVGQQIGQQINQGVSQSLSGNAGVLDTFRRSLHNIGMSSTDIDAVAQRILNLDVQISSLNQSLSHTSGAKGDRKLLNIEVGGIDKFGQAVTLTQTWDIDLKELIKDVDAVSSATQKASSGAASFADKQKQAVASAKNSLSTIESKLNDKGANKTLANTDFDANGLNQQLDKVRNAITALENANKNTFAQAKIDVDTEITSLNNLITTLKNAEYAATSLRTKDINTVKIDEGNNLNTFVQKMEQSGHYTDELKQKVTNLKSQLNDVFDANSLTSYLNGLSNLQSEFKAVDAAAKTTEKATKIQTNIAAEKKILQQYANELKEAGILTGDVKQKIQDMFYSLSKVDSQNGLTTWRAELKGVRAETDAVLKSIQTNFSRAEKESDQLINKLKGSYQSLKNLEIKKDILDVSKDINKIEELDEQIKTAKKNFDSLFAQTSTNSNFDLSRWAETKSAIDAAIESQIKYNSAKKQDDLTSTAEKEVDSLTILKSKWEEQNILVGEFKNKVEQLESSLTSVGSNDELNGLKVQIQELKTEASQIAEVNKIQLSMDNGHGASEYQNRINSVITSLERYGVETKEAQNITASLQSTLNSMKGLSGQELVTQADKLEQEFKAVKASVDEAKLSYDKLMQPASKEKISTTLLKVQKLLSNNTRVTEQVKQEWQSYVNRLSSGSNIAEKEIKDINIRLKETESQMRGMGKLGFSWSDKLKQAWEKFGGWGFATGTMMTLVNQLRKIPKEVYEIDTAMTDLYKVTDETTNKYTQFLNSTSDSAHDLGRSISSLVEQAANWAKLGFSLDEAEQLAKISSIYANVGEVDNDTAVSDMVTAMKAFNIEASDSITIVDKLNKLGNEYATSAADLGNGLSRSASAMATSGTDINKTLAMLTGGAEITQNASEFGNFLKVGSMRIRGMKGDLEALGEEVDETVDSISKVQTQILNRTGGKVNIFDDMGNFRDYYDIMEDIAKVYDDLNDPDKADLTEILFGKQRGNQGAALIQAFQSGQIQKALEATLNAEGSAMQEQERWMKSLEAKTQQFEAAFQSLSSTILDSDLLKWFVDFGTGSVQALDNIIDKFGSLGTIGLGAGIFAGFKNVGVAQL